MPTPLPVLDAILQGWKEYQDQLVSQASKPPTE
jgi:hypothetical protein